jgi:hypothetical protein
VDDELHRRHRSLRHVGHLDDGTPGLPVDVHFGLL